MTRETTRETLGGRLRQARIRKGWRQRQLAAAAGITQPFICRIERGDKTPSEVMITRLAAALDVPREELTGEVAA